MRPAGTGLTGAIPLLRPAATLRCKPCHSNSNGGKEVHGVRFFVGGRSFGNQCGAEIVADLFVQLPDRHG